MPVGDPTQRFTRRVETYRRYRPGYPPALFDAILAAAPPPPPDSQRIVADIGAGTGLSAEPLLQRGCTVFCVEPNGAMRAACEDALSTYPGFTSVCGTAEATTLPNGTAHIITSGQAVHWFRLDEARREFARIATPGACLALFWNTRDVSASPFVKAYNALVLRHSGEFRQVYHGNMEEARIVGLFGGPARYCQFNWSDPLTWEVLRGRTLSSSYMPDSGPAMDSMLADLQSLFDQYQTGGSVHMLYRTELWIGPVPER